MALSDQRILEEMDRGDIVIFPFQRDNVATSSYDVTLGSYFYRERRLHERIYNIWSKSQTEKVWGEPEEARKASEVLGPNYEWDGISPTDHVILLERGETILAHTEEFIGGKNHITTMMKARSSMGRNFIEVCKCAGWGDVGFFNRWTMEITNNSQHYSIPLIVGRRISQIIFFETGPIILRDYSTQGKYQESQILEKLKENWEPSLMLPRLWKDREIKKTETTT